MTRTFSTNKTEILENVRASLQSGKPMEPIRITAAIDEDPVVKGIVTSIRETGNGWYRVEVGE